MESGTEQDPAALAAQLDRLERRVIASEREFSTLTRIAQTVASTLDLEQLLAVILEQLKALIDYSAAGIVLVEDDIARFFDYRGPLPRDLVLSWRFPMSVAGYQLVTSREGAILVDDVHEDTSFARVYKASLGDLLPYFADVRSWMGLSLIARGRVIGFLRLSHTEPHFFTPEHVRLLEGVAGHAAIAIENARLLQAERERLAEVQRRRQVAESLRGILSILNSNTPSDFVLNYILDQACHLLNTDTATIYRLNEETNLLIPRATRNIPEDFITKLKVAIGQAAVGQAVLQRRPVVLSDFASLSITTLSESDQELLVNWVSANFKTMMSVPLLIKNKVYGGITLYFRESRTLATEDTELAMSFADQAALAIENARLYTQVSELASLEERQRLARELHDSVSQALYGIQLGAQTARELINDDLPDADLRTALVEPLNYVLSLAEAGLAEMRALIFELRPESLKFEGLVGALTKQANALRVRHHLEVDAELGQEPELSIEAKEALYRIAQEALHNAVKHAHATRLTLRLDGDDRAAELYVGDDGEGFDISETFPGHLGLRSMRERAERLDGKVDIQSSPKNGTHVRVRIPKNQIIPGN